MAKIKKAKLTKLEIIQVATRMFLKKGYSSTTVKAIADELDISTGNLTFHYPTKEHMLAELTNMLCGFQWQMMKTESDEGISSLLALCLELTTMAAICRDNDIAKDFFVSSYQSQLCLDIIHFNDTARAKNVFAEYCGDWSEMQFAEAEILVAGIEYATLMAADNEVPLDIRIAGALNQIMSIYNVPENIRKIKIRKALATDYISLGMRVIQGFIDYVEKANEQAYEELMASGNG